MLSLFSDRNEVGFLVATPLLGAVFGLAWNQLGDSAATLGGTRDFASANQILAPRFMRCWSRTSTRPTHMNLLTTMPREVRI